MIRVFTSGGKHHILMQSVRSITILINPEAGSESGSRVRSQVEPVFAEAFRGWDVQLIETTSKEHTIELGATLTTDLIVAVSGDGTLHNLAQGILSRPRTQRPALSVIPVGSGNDYARTLGVSSDPSTAIRELGKGVRVAVDVGRCNDTWYLETFSFGVDAAVAQSTIALRKTTRASGALLYAHAAILAIFTNLKTNHFRYTIDGQQQSADLLICAIQNGATYGGGFKITPHATITDGKLNLCMVTRMGVFRALYLLARMYRGHHEKYPQVSSFTASSLTIEVDGVVPVQCDGEPQTGNHFEVSVMPKALDVIVPRSSPVLS